jgi:tRNA pseudouridine55 synthase
MSVRSGVIVLDKPVGVTSNAVLGKLKRLLGRPKMGFLGTLDPLATGVLPVFLGKATKLIPAFEGLDKAYRVTIRLGETTDTYDAEGEITQTRSLDGLTPEGVREAALTFQGELEQLPPAYSAIKHGGVPGYRLAREGKPVPEKRRTVRVWDLTVEEIALPEVTLALSCSAGTYVRSLAHDLGAVLGVGGHVIALRRLRNGSLFTLERSVTLEMVEGAVENGDDAFLLDLAELLPDHVPYPVSEAEERLLRNGNRLILREEMASGTPLKALSARGELLAVGQVVSLGRSGLGFQPSKVLV